MRRVSMTLPLAALFLAPWVHADESRRQIFLDLVKERHIPPVDKANWAAHVGQDAIWVGRGLRVARRAEVEGVQIDTGKTVEIKEFEAHDYGDTAVLTYVVVEHHPQAGGERVIRLRKLDTYVLRDKRWQLVSNAEVLGQPDRKAVTLSPATLDRYVGSYELLLEGKPIRTKVWREGSRLFAQTDGQEKGELLPLSQTVFFDATEPQEGGPENVFVIGADGKVTEWIYRDAGVEFHQRRLP
jgi:uncharacterized protein DUF4440